MSNTTNRKNETKGSTGETARSGGGLGLSATQIIAGGAAAAVASIIGGHLGLAGTVTGAFILSVVSAIALPLFRASLEKSHEHLRRAMLQRKRDGVSTASRPARLATAGESRMLSGSGRISKGRRVWMAAGGTAIMFLVGVGSVLGIQSATGVGLSRGTSVLQSSVSQAVGRAGAGQSVPPTSPKPGAPSTEPATVPTDRGSEPVATRTDQPTPTPTLPNGSTPSSDPTTPASADTRAPVVTPAPSVATSAGAAPGQ